ncbi:gliding motility-associated peptidyl-prolyl isomerase GldI [Salinimicrobium sp. TH3]|uniref:gliding motility-associated peptidyl-prolyl isomerase GldI n=1 Tax=Salinimicrobium sp. TH3 TaxID=2997342 RepID=UPI00227614A8|nr:gliding motility-associated peptidyl-prolyl isomerase GldI [Salinimicrobium sp. TH3]MCY2687323.1 gliding motility-associated peptidyl-prolyl isomerase GldI [Salinimicrobium sp. TH3]
MKVKFLMLLAGLLLFSCKSPEARRPVTQKSGSYINEAVERNRKIVAEEESQIQKIIEKDSTREYLSSPNGFWYYYNTKDTTSTRTPQFGEVVEFDYNLKTLDGQNIYSDEEIAPRTYTIDKEQLFSGLRQGLKLMKEGETVTFLFPSHKAFGYYGDKNRIGKDVPVISTVTLIDISEEPETNQINNN